MGNTVKTNEAQIYKAGIAQMLSQIQDAKAIMRIYRLTQYIWKKQP